jgi:hypothetical protein
MILTVKMQVTMSSTGETVDPGSCPDSIPITLLCSREAMVPEA